MYKFVVYKTVNLVNNRYYIGVHRTKNVNDKYLGSGVLLRVAIKKYGRENFKKEILEIFDSYEDAFGKEKEIVTLELIEKGECYNLHCGGDGNWDSINYGKLKHLHPSSNWDTANEEIKKKMIEGGRKGFKHANLIRSQMIKDGLLKNEGFKGKKHSEESKEKMREGWLKRKQSGFYKNPQLGKCWIHKNKENKIIHKEELNQFLIDGWVIGRKLKWRIDRVW